MCKLSDVWLIHRPARREVFHFPLIEMAAICPSNVEEFAKIKGVGQAKPDKFAEAFLAVVSAC